MAKDELHKHRPEVKPSHEGIESARRVYANARETGDREGMIRAHEQLTARRIQSLSRFQRLEEFFRNP